MFNSISFIKAPNTFNPADHENCTSPIFRRCFDTARDFKKATLAVCGLGYGYYYLNGKNITDELFTAPESDYMKTLWYNVYDVTDLLREGKNIFYVMCGNGYFNEIFKTSWDYEKAAWRDNPKFIMQLIVDGKTVLTSDENWKCTVESPVIYNQLRCGEHYDARLYDEKQLDVDYDDTTWDNAVIDTNPPSGTFRECTCQPIRECEIFKTRTFTEKDGHWTFDIGQNISGYIRLHVNQTAGDIIKIEYAEEIDENLCRIDNGMSNHYRESKVQTDEYICGGGDETWSPRFAYHGFRYIILTGIKNPSADNVCGVFVHQDVKPITEFSCSNERLNRLFEIGQNACLSNMFWKLTDCPTREKLGWANDAQASCEHMLYNFDIAELLEKWQVDIADAMNDEGMLPGIIPTSGWGYQWGNGPVSEGILFEIPYRIYLIKNDDSLLVKYLPYFKRAIDGYKTKMNSEGYIEYGLNDWAPPSPTNVPTTFINAVFYIRFLRIASLAAEKAGETIYKAELNGELDGRISAFKTKYIDHDGKCTINEQTSTAMIIAQKLYDDISPLAEQLKTIVEAADFHHNCGMVGIRYIYDALTACGLSEYAFKIITSDGYPSYMAWLSQGATTLWEMWDCNSSHNHHMYSDFMGWLIKNIAGIKVELGITNVSPSFVPQLSSCHGSRMSENGKLCVDWNRQTNGNISLEITVPDGDSVYYGENILNGGIHKFII